MKNFRRVLLAVVFAVILALGAVCITACGDKTGDDNTTKSRYTLTFMVGTVVYDTVSAEAGSEYKSKMKESPTRPNYVFDGWSQQPNGEIEQLPDKMPSGDRTYYAIFSARFNLSFNAGIGSIPDDKKTMVVKEGDDLYALVSTVTPTLSDSDATFKGWFLRGTSEITSTSGQKMPKSNVEVVAKYSVGYKINIYMEERFDSGNYPETPDEIVTKTAYVGDRVTGLPSYLGFYYDESKTNDILYANLNKNSAQNAFELYYKLIGYDTIFNANLPSEVTYTGEMDKMTCGHGEEYIAPDCQFEADGYRFYGWSTTPDGDVEYRVGEEFSVERSTTMYAQWVKGMTEIAGLSSDRVYLIDQKVDGVLRVIPYLERTGLDDIAGEYNKTTHVFTFKNVAANSDEVLLRGIADSAHNTFTYINTENTTVYKLQKIDGTEDASVTLKLNDNGTAVYNDGTDNVNGNYVAGNDGSMLFTVDGKTEFAFQLVHSPQSFVNFMIRGEEYGTWNNITQAGIVDTAYTLEFDGYGHATMYVSGWNNSLSNKITSQFGGWYLYTTGDGAYTGDEGIEVGVMLYNSSLQARQFYCLLMKGAYHTISADDTTVYTNVYLQRFETTLYGAPATGSELDTATADKIELAGYSVVADSATYTYTDGNGETVTVKGNYSYDSTAGTLRIRRTGGADLLFEVSLYGEGNDRVPVFEPVEELFGMYAVSGLDSVFGPNLIYTLSIYNNNRAAFFFQMPMYDDAFYGNIVFDYTRVIVGDYTVASYGKAEDGGSDPRANVYEFTAEISPTIAAYIYNLYGGIFQYPLYINAFGSFRFQFVYSATTGNISYINVTIRGDFQGGRKVTYNDVEYTLDGFGTAESESGKITYSYSTSMGIARLFLIPDDTKPTETVLYIDYDDKFVAYEKGYTANNCTVPFFMMFFKDGTALLTLDSSSSTLEAFAFGHVTWDDDDHTSGTYIRDDSIEFSDDYLTVNKTIKNFKFVIRTATIKDKDGKDQTSSVIYVYDVNAVADEDNEIVIVNADGDELILKPLAVTEIKDGQNNPVNVPSAAATYIKKGTGDQGDTEYNGTFRFVGDKVVFVYTTQTEGSAQTTTQSITFKIESGSEGGMSFRRVGGEEGYSLSADDGKSYLYLSGEAVGENKSAYGGVYYKYDAESKTYTQYNGTYEYTGNQNALFDRTFGLGYDFTYETGEQDENGDPVVDEDGNNVTETFTFGVASTQTGVMYFKEFIMQVEQNVLYMSASIGQPAKIGNITGGGYAAHVLTLYPNTVYQTQYQGILEWNTDWEVWTMTTTDGSQFFFKIISGIGVFLLDNTYVAQSKGMFTLSEDVVVQVPAVEGQDATEDTPAVPAVPAHTAVAKKIEMSGMAFAYLHYDYETEDGEIEDRIISGIYVQYATNGFAFIMVGSEDTSALFRFRLQMRTDEETDEVTYVAELADMDYYGTFTGENLTVINLNGYNYAYYVDSYGRVYGGQFTVLDRDEDSALIEIMYLDSVNYTINYTYARLNFEDRTFVEVDESEIETRA